MGQAIGDFLPSAVGVAISPLPIVAVVLMLVTPRGRVNGPGSYVVFVAIATIGVAAPVVIAFALGDRSRKVLDDLKAWLAHNNAVIMAVLLLIIGVKLIGKAISGFST